MHDGNSLLFWRDHSNTYIVLSFTELYSLCSSLNFSNKDLVEPDTKTSRGRTTRHVAIVTLCFLLLFA